MKSAGKSVAVLGVVILLGFVAYNQGWIGNGSTANLGVGDIPTLGETQSVAGTQTYRGNFNLSTETYDTLDSTNTGLGDDTELDTVCYQKIGSNVDDWKELGVVSEAETGDTNIAITSDTMTEMWCEVHPEDSQEYYIDAQKIVQKNDEVKSFIWDDADADNEDSYIFQVDLSNIDTGSDREALMTLNWYVYDEETSDTIVDTTTASVGSVSTGEVTSVIQWNVDLDTSATGGDAKYLHSIRIRLNSTDDTDWVESKTTLAMPDGTSLSLLDMSRSDLASTTEYKYQFPDGNDYAEAFLVSISKDTSTEVDFPMNFRSAFESNDALCVELGLRYINPEGVVSSYDTDDVEITNASVGTECTL